MKSVQNFALLLAALNRTVGSTGSAVGFVMQTKTLALKSRVKVAVQTSRGGASVQLKRAVALSRGRTAGTQSSVVRRSVIPVAGRFISESQSL